MAPEGVTPLPAVVPVRSPIVEAQTPLNVTLEADAGSAAPPESAPPAPGAAEVPAAAQAQVKQTIEALEQWLDAIHVSRSDRSS